MKFKLFLLSLFVFSWAGSAHADQKCNGADNCGPMQSDINSINDPTVTAGLCATNTGVTTNSCTDLSEDIRDAIPGGVDRMPIRVWAVAWNALETTEECTIGLTCISPSLSQTNFTGGVDVGTGTNVTTTGTLDSAPITGAACPGGSSIRYRVTAHGTCTALQTVTLSYEYVDVRNDN